MKLTDIQFAYVATPYSRYIKGIHGAYLDACRLCAKLDRAGVVYYCPVAETHGVAMHGGIDPLDARFWLRRDLLRARFCDAMLIGELHGWDESHGVAEEALHFRGMLKPVINIDPDTLEIRKVWMP